MRRLVALAGLVAGLVSPLALSSATVAVGETCRGLPATIVGQPRTSVSGTDGRDVIVTNGAISVDALGGDDVICTTATAGASGAPVPVALRVNAGAGVDTVDRTADTDPQASALVDLVEYFVGGPAADDVFLDGSAPVEILTRGGPDVVSAPSYALTGVVDLGTGADRFDSESGELLQVTPVLSVEGGPGRDELRTRLAGRGVWTIDNARGLLEGPHGSPFEFGRFEVFDAVARGSSGVRVNFSGTAAAETLMVHTGVVRYVVMRSGADRLELSGATSRHARLEGGLGRDLLSVTDVRGRTLRVDLASGRLVAGRDVVLLDDFDDVRGFGLARVHLLGDPGDNRLSAVGCLGARADGRGGADDLRFLAVLDGVPTTSACPGPVRFTARGDGDDDILVGGPTGDLLDGGRGHDTANGRGGRDVCVSVEEPTSCERR